MKLADRMFVVLASTWHNVAAVMKEAAVFRDDGHGEDSGVWHIVPNMGYVSNSVIADDTTPFSTKSVPKVIDKMKAKYERVCATMRLEMDGALSNTMSAINPLMEYSMIQGLSWLMPEVMPPVPDVGSSFPDLFGDPDVDMGCPAKPIPKWEAHCPFDTEMPEEVGVFDGSRTWFGKKCHPEDMETFAEPLSARSTLCGCDAIIVFYESNRHFNYEVTADVLSHLYWNGKEIPDFTFPISTIHHVRLGDVEGSDVDNFVNGSRMAQMVGAFAASSQINATCLNVTIVTDGDLHDEHVATVKRAWGDMGVKSVGISGITDPVGHAFDIMTHSGIMLGGPSGFPRFAAVLSKSRVKLFYDDRNLSHPIQYLKGTTTFPDAADFEEMKEAMATNSELKSLVDDCSQWLSR